MPRAFHNCVRRGGRVRTIKLKCGKHHCKCKKICFKGGKSYAGHSFRCKRR